MSKCETVINQIYSEISACQSKYDARYVKLYYRGQADKAWRLVPKIMRPEYAHIAESSVMERAKTDCWNYSHSIVDNIAHLQHYGYPTRFLDFTTDIDIALYFICSEQEDKDGMFYIFPYSERPFSNIDSILIAEIACLKVETPLLDFSKQMIEKYPKYQSRYYNAREFGMNILSWIDHGFMIAPTEEERVNLKAVNPRLYNQNGAFYVFGNKTKEPVQCASTLEVPRCVILPEIMDNSNVFRLHHFITVPVPRNTKGDILNYLLKKGINKSFIYPDMT